MTFFRGLGAVSIRWGRRLGFVVCLAASMLLAQGGEYLIKTWEVDDGLPESGVTDVAQTDEGYLWVGTLNSGLSRFDGARFVNFDSSNTPQLAGRGVRRLILGRDGTLWINEFGNYLASWREGRFQPEYPGPAVLTSLVLENSNRIVFATQDAQLLQGTGAAGISRVWKKIAPSGADLNPRFYADRSGAIWYRRRDRQLARLVGEQAELMPPGATNTPALALAGDEQANIVVGTRQGLLAWAGDHFEDLTPTNGEPELAVSGLASDGQGGWWVEANRRLRRCQGRRWIAEAVDWREQRRAWTRVRHEQADRRGGLWLAYVDGGLVHISEQGQVSSLTTRERLPSNAVRSIFQDRENNLWASFERGGLVRVRPRRFDVVGKNEGLADTVTTSVCEDAEGAVWIGTFGGTVVRYAEGRCTNFALPLVGTHCEKALVYPAADGRVWVGTHGNGVLVYEKGEFRQVLSARQIGVRVRAMLVDRERRVWVASQDGLFCLAGGEVRKLQTPGWEEDYPTALAEGAAEVIWVGMNTGALLRCAAGSLTTFQPADAALRRRFSAVFVDSSDSVWIGTLGAGLLRFSEGQFAALTTAEGLPTDTISQVLEDSAGGFWLGSRAGVFSAPKAALEACARGAAKSVPCRLYGRDDGLPTLGCSLEFQPTAWRGRDGRLWFATGNGVTCILQGDYEINRQPPPVLIEEVRVDGKVQQPGGVGPGGSTGTGARAGAGDATTRFEIGPGRHQLQFRYTGLSFTAPDRVRFRYMLEGLDTGWSDAMGSRTASYNSVPAGQYRFRVKACNSDGVWSEKDAALALTIQPQIWETWWFRGASLAGLLLAVGGAGWAYERRRTRRRIELLERQQLLERERARVARDLHDELGAGLTEIGLVGGLAQRANAAPGRVRSDLAHITAKSREMVISLDEIVWSLNPRHDSLVSLSKYFCEYAQQFLQLAPLRCRMEVAEELPDYPLSSEQRRDLLLAFKEALTNVVRHAEAAEVHIGIRVADKALIITVADDGRGLAAAPQTEGADGLTNLSRRLEQLGGRCEVQSAPGRGTTVRLVLPLPRIAAA